MRVLILAAGYGTRLYPLIKDTPKALLDVAGRPLMDHLLDRIKDLSGLNEIIVVTNDKFHQHFSRWAEEREHLPAPVTVVNDGTRTPDDRLGSVGDINFAIQQNDIQDDLLVMGGDNLFDFALEDYIVFAQGKAPNASIGLYNIDRLEDAKQFGVVAVDDTNKIVSFDEKPAQPQSTLIAMCFYYLPAPSLGLIAEYLSNVGKADKAGDYIRWLVQNKGVYGFTFTGKWYDIGSMESYEEAQAKFRTQ